MRWFDDNIKNLLFQRVRDCCKGIELSYGVECKLEWTSEIHPPVINNKKCSNNVKQAIKQVLPFGLLDNEPPTMVGEDFSLYLNERPVCFFFLGCGIDGDIVHPHHKSSFQHL